MSIDEDPDGRPAKKIKLDSDSSDFTSNEEQMPTNFPKPMAVLSEEYTRTDVETVSVYVAEIINPKIASKCVRELKELFPLKDLSHLKRIKRTSSMVDKQVLQIILRGVFEDESKNTQKEIFGITDIVDGVSTKELGKPFIVKVPKQPPLTKDQFIKASKLWPVNFHEDKYITKLLSGDLFDNLALRKINSFMNMAVKSAVVGKNNEMVAMGAVIVDPSRDNVIAVAYDLRCHGHPLHHAVMVVIDLVAQSQNGGTWNMGYQHNTGSWILPQNIDAISVNKKKNDLKSGKQCSEQFSSRENLNRTKENKDTNITISNDTLGDTAIQESKLNQDSKNGPYLCTGYDLYVTSEPCVMCAMALVHSRISRVFYGCKDPRIGALGSKYSLHTQDGLNHHFEAFYGVLEKECSSLMN